MSTIYMSQLSTALPLMEGGGDHHHHHHHHQDHHHRGHFQAFTLPAKNPPNLFPFVISSSNPIDGGGGGGYGSDHPHHLRQQHHAMLDQQPQHMIGGSSSVFLPPPPLRTVESIRDDMIERSSSFEPYGMEKLHGAASGSAKDAGKWPAAAASAPAKMRITRKASDPGVVGGPVSAKKPRRRAQQAYDEGYSHSGGGAMNHALGVIRTCSDCSTTKTPLWRSGPRGPKSLCNACGIRQRKARRALMASSTAAAAASTGGGPTATPSTGGDAAAARPKAKKEKIRVDVDRSLPFKKRCKVVQDHGAAAPVEAAGDPVAATAAAAAAPARDLAENMAAIKWCKSPTACDAAAAACIRPSAAQDEITDAAMLLMTLSCASDRSRIRDAIRDVPPQAFFLPY